ncbi:MAG: hypothetical protein JSS27_05390 [Planctomycetes bacterium]|nr:hypothetical protein [Planctomycetota bacterium]
MAAAQLSRSVGLDRRTMLGASLAAGATMLLPRAGWAADATSEAIQRAHDEIWQRFVDRHGILVDFADLDGRVELPTPEECRAGKPNALGWFQPIENGAMFNGMYIDALLCQWEQTRSPEAAAKARRLMQGLLLLASISNVRGLVGRGVSADGRSHYPMGSNDQTSPWFFGLYRFLSSGLATAEEHRQIIAKLVEVADAIYELGWKMPAEAPFNIRGSFAGIYFDAAARLLFVAKLMHHFTGDKAWADRYAQALDERGGEANASRRELMRGGMKFYYAKTHHWTSCAAVCCLRGLWELETDATLKQAYAEGLRASANLAAESLPLAEKYNAADPSTFSQDWRSAMMPLWKPQQTEQESQALAEAQLRAFMKVSPRRNLETAAIREPTAAAWIVTLCPDAQVVRQHAATIKQMATRYDYARLYYCTFFWIEGAVWRLRALPPGGTK